MSTVAVSCDLLLLVFDYGLTSWVVLRDLAQDLDPTVATAASIVLKANLKRRRGGFCFTAAGARDGSYPLLHGTEVLRDCFQLPVKTNLTAETFYFTPRLPLNYEFQLDVTGGALLLDNCCLQLEFEQPIPQPFTVVIDAKVDSRDMISKTVLDGMRNSVQISTGPGVFPAHQNVHLLTQSEGVQEMQHACIEFEQTKTPQRELYVVTFDGSQSCLRVSGVEILTEAVLGTQPLDGITLGSDIEMNYCMKGEVFRAMVIPERLSVRDLEALEGYCLSKFTKQERRGASNDAKVIQNKHC